MHLLLTDRLTCPRCGPPFGLILLAHRLENRVVHHGELGCPNCRDRYPVEDGFGDLRAPPRGALSHGLLGDPAAVPAEGGHRLVAQLGIVGGPGTVALVGAPCRYATSVARALDEVQVVAVDPDLRRWPETDRVSRLVAAPGLPLHDQTARAIALDGRLEHSWVSEAARVVSRGGRVVIVGALDRVGTSLEDEGLVVLASDDETVVAARG